ncbi:MAG: VCBS repeat-containing protein, partial [Candidatus Thermoplasmatota archaeon]|nr:VCBS repeat-containing protein [Candidatus Thermoplasmatota archaeon]
MGPRWLTFSFSLLLVFSSGVCYIPYGVEAQGTPQYNDVSNGLPVQSLWVSKVRFNDFDEDGMDEVSFLGPRKGSGDRSLHVMQWNENSWTNVSSAFGTEVIDHHSYGGFDFGDVDNDGDVDMIAGSHGNNPVAAFLKESGGTWGKSEILKDCEDCDNQDAWSIDIGDYNVDGFLDVLVGGFWDMDLTPFANSGDGNWVQQGEGIVKGRASNVQAYFVDVNRDGFLDLIANLRDGSWVYLGDGQGGWTDSSAGLPVESGSDDSPFSIDWGDFNNDGFVDLALCTVDFDDAHLYAFLGDGEGGWTDNSVGLPNQAYRTVKLADMNQDKYDDIVGLTPNGVVETYLATETGGWVKSQNTLQGNAQGYRMEVGDFDDNGHRDIIAGFGTDQAGYPGSVKVWQETTTVTSLGIDVDYPDGMETFLGGSVRFIHWLSEITSTTGERSIKLEYSTDGIDGVWELISEGVPDTGTFQWNVPFENSEDCYIRITLTDELDNSVDDVSDNSFAIISPSNGAPQIELNEPEGVVDDNYTISWVASDPDEDLLTIDLYYDIDTQSDEKMLIVSGLENSGEYVWNTSEIEEGEYYLLGVVMDTSQEESDYTSELLQIEHPDSPVIIIETPQSEGDIVDENYVIRWEASDSDDDELMIGLYYSSNDDWENLILIESQLSNTGEYQWDTTQIEAGMWFICGSVNDGELENYDCSEYSLEINHTKPNNLPQITIYSPTMFEEIDDVINIQWSV